MSKQQSKLRFKHVKDTRSQRLKKSSEIVAVSKTEDSLEESSPSIADEEELKQRLNELESLKLFDHNVEYGPATGISRLERWERAAKFGLRPPLKIKNILTKHANEAEFTESVWDCYNL
ncbi:DNA polymerase delta subunit 4-like [Oscarella lobularis]|uniref:DNA polymerase delta subunit 4-like n=1 Tax=Oscarella lobularis TaxID=121494 RepID=UPI0033132591